MKRPSMEDFQNYTGLHCHRIWAEVGSNYVCPSCGRNKFQILHWTKRFPNKPTAFYDWVATLHRHHDHSDNSMRRNSGRFPETIICGQCNASDGAAKRKLNLPKNFSFSPSEIGQFVQSTPHDKHTLDFQKADEIYRRLKGTETPAFMAIRLR